MLTLPFCLFLTFPKFRSRAPLIAPNGRRAGVFNGAAAAIVRVEAIVVELGAIVVELEDLRLPSQRIVRIRLHFSVSMEEFGRWRQ